MKYYLLLILLVVIGLTKTNAQSFDAELLLGTWELQKKENEAPKDLPNIMSGENSEASDNTTKEEIFLFFQENNIIDIEQSGSKFKYDYMLQDSLLRIGGSVYKILELTEDRLTHIEVQEYDFFPSTYYFERTLKKIEPIKEKEEVKELFDNGQLKLLGTLERGFQNGIWTEWYPNGAIKSVRHLNNEVLIMKVEFDSTGTITYRTRLNFQTGQYIRE